MPGELNQDQGVDRVRARGQKGQSGSPQRAAWRAVLGIGKTAYSLTEAGSLWGVLKQKSDMT